MAAAPRKCTKTGSNLFYYDIYIFKQFTALYPRCQRPSAAKGIAVPRQTSAFHVEITGDELKSVKSKIRPDAAAAGVGVPAVPRSGLRQGAELRVLQWSTTNSQSITSPLAPARRGRNQLLWLPSGSVSPFLVPVMGCEKQQAPAVPPPLPNAPRARLGSPRMAWGVCKGPSGCVGLGAMDKGSPGDGGGQDKGNTSSSPHPTIPGPPCGATGSRWGC